MRTQDFVPLEYAKDGVSIILDGAEGMGEGCIVCEIFLQRFLLCCRVPLCEIVDDLVAILHWVVHILRKQSNYLQCIVVESDE